MTPCKVELGFTSLILECKATVLIVRLLSSSRYHAPCQRQHACIVKCIHCNNCSGTRPSSSHLFSLFPMQPIQGKKWPPRPDSRLGSQGIPTPNTQFLAKSIVIHKTLRPQNKFSTIVIEHTTVFNIIARNGVKKEMQ